VIDGDAPSIVSASAGTEALIEVSWNQGCKDSMGSYQDQVLRQQIIKENTKDHSEAEDANLKLLRSLPSAWNNIALIMRNKSDLDTMSMDDLYNNLKVSKAEIKGQSSSCLNSQNVAFVSSENTSSTNEIVNTTHKVSTASLQGQAYSSTYADDVIYGSQMAGGHAYHEGEEILKEDTKESEFQWQRNY
ncbi:hypothetical protein Tco_0125476, partial [Tanacetum coccineum]